MQREYYAKIINHYLFFPHQCQRKRGTVPRFIEVYEAQIEFTGHGQPVPKLRR